MSKLAAAVLLAVAAMPLCASAEPRVDGPMGVNWGVIYGFPPVKAEKFMPQARALGASFARVTLYWSQLEPKQGVARWNDLDAFTDQLQSSEEGLLTIACASPWATRTKTWVFPSSPAADPKAYYAFVRRVVE